MWNWERSWAGGQAGTAVREQHPCWTWGAWLPPSFPDFSPPNGGLTCPVWLMTHSIVVRIKWKKMWKCFKMQSLSGTFEKNTFLWLSCHNYSGKKKQNQTISREKCNVIKPQNQFRKKNVENCLNHKQSMFHMYFHFQNITLSFFFHAMTLPTVTHYLKSVQNLENNWTRMSGRLGFSLVIIKPCSCSAEWPGP